MTLESAQIGIKQGNLAAKYACQGPRYTSYPTAPHFDTHINWDAVESNLLTPSHDAYSPLSIYVHIPFCNDICYYCACNKKVTRDRAEGQRYLSALGREIALQSERYGDQRPVRQLHWGGGSPTWLDKAELTQLMHELASHFHLLDHGEREYAIEIDPRSVDRDDIALLKGLGFNRLSLGIQDFDPLVQRAINRIQPFSDVAELVEEIRRHSFRSLSFDLIYGLPMQDTRTMALTLERVMELKPDRIACYNYAHLPERFSHQRSIDRMCLPGPEEKLTMQSMITDTLTAAGYQHIGMDHYVLPDDDLALAQQDGRLQRNFQGYSVQMARDLLGLGVSAISHIGDFYFQNEVDLKTYYDKLENGVTPIWRGLASSAEDKLRRHIIMQLICNLYLDIDDCEDSFGIEFSKHFAHEIDQLDDMEQDGLLSISSSGIRVHEQGRPLLRNICMIFDQFLDRPGEQSTMPRYSATV